jgi:hypothetical protein
MRRIVGQLRAEEFEVGAAEEAFPTGGGLDGSIHSP